MKKGLKGIDLLLGIIMLFGSCESWLEVKMKDKILENELYEDLEGYTTALNGIYAELNNTTIYGAVLSMGTIDVMAQYYDVLTPEAHTMSVYGKYDFNQSTYKSLFSSVWSKMYSLLANINLLLENCERPDVPLPGVMKGLVTGETYALRGMLHFDLLRMYGPVYRDNTKNVKVMPYMTEADRSIRPLQTAEQIINMVIDDLEKAAALLRESDPVIEKGAKNGSLPEDVNNNLNYRQYRLNYYAVQALLARAYLWAGNQAKAVACATEVIKVSEGAEAWFPFVGKSEVLKPEDPDRIFSTEVLFALYNTSRENLYKSYFQETQSDASRLTLFGTYNEGRLRTLFPDENDTRFSLWESSLMDTVEVLYCKKFEDVKEPKYQYMIPLIRTSEMYLLLAECSDSDQEATDYINKIRYARGCRNIAVTPENKEQLIREEFTREMMGEGQLFFYYKRKGMESIPSGQSADAYMDMPLINYVWILPDEELENRYNE